MNAHIYTRIEIAFWDFVIQTLSENNQVRKLVKLSYRVAHHKDIKRVSSILAASALAGLLSGFMLCVITVYIRK